MIEDFTDRHVTVMGLGRFGGGLGVTRWLAAQGAIVCVTDRAAAASLSAACAGLDDLVRAGRVRLRLGGHDEADFTDSALVIANPAVPKPWADPYLEAARRAGVPVTTEIRLLTERVDRGRTIGVTGSAGKSTTAAMIRHALDRAGHGVRLGGNIGGSLLTELDAIDPDDWIVLELSSAMLHWLGDPPWSPHVAVLTNLEPNHLDWHGTFEHYRAAKLRIFAAQGDDDHAVRGDDVPEPDPPLPLAIPGAHNRRNAAVAAEAVARATGMEPRDALRRLADFPGLSHRLELVAETGGRRFFNDSKATTPGATERAVESFPEPARVHLIAGGYDKEIDLAPITTLADALAGFYTIGATGPALARATPRAASCGTLEVAVRRAVARMSAGDVLLLSPGCASWDQFDNFEQRGDAFRALVRREAP
jgi:UDP-N-acetylmuramoylalanine--D-glutamate ligase